MPGRAQHGDEDFTEADRQAIAKIRRELDAEFGSLEPGEPLSVQAPPVSTPRPRARPRPAAPAVPLFLLGTLVGGAVGGITGGLTTLLWLQYADDRSARAPASSIDGASVSSSERGTAVTEHPAAATREPRSDLESALNDWIEATKAGDIEAQMRFYPARVPVYYTWRDATREAVRAEKMRVFGDVTQLEISTDTPTVELADDGAHAVSRFRKRYVIEGPSVRRRGEVLQELRWARTAAGWRIVAERDAEVLAPSASVGPDTAKRGGTIDPAR